MTNTTTQLKSVFLTFLMVMSVFAAAPAVVSADASSVTINAQTVDLASDTVNVTVTESDGADDLVLTDGSGTEIGSASLASGNSTETITLNDNAETGTYQVTATVGSAQDTATLDVYSSDKVRYDSESHELVTASERYWDGQTLFVKDFGNNQTTVELYQDKDGDSATGDNGYEHFVSELNLDENGEALLTTSVGAGEYQLQDGSGVAITNDYNSQATTFEIAEQSFSAASAKDSVYADQELELDVDSNRGDYQVQVESSDLTVSQIDSVFQGANEDGVLSSDDFEQGNIMVNNLQGNVDAGTYEVTLSVGDTGVTDTVTFEVLEVGDENIEFESGLFTESQGNVAEIVLNLQNTDRAQIVIGDVNEVGYEVKGDVTDTDSDGTVTLQVNTFNGNVTEGEGTEFVQDGNIQYSGTGGIELLDQGDYPLEVHLADSGYDGLEHLSTLSINERSTDSASAYIAPAGESFGSAEDIEAGFDEGYLSQSSSIADGDTLVVEVAASGVYGIINDNPDIIKNATDVQLKVYQTDAGPNQDPVFIDTSEFTVVPDREGDVVYFSTKVNDDLDFVDADGNPASLSTPVGEEFTAEFVVNGSSDLAQAGEDEAVSTQFSVANSNNNINKNIDGYTQVEASSNAEIAGTSTLAPGSTVNIQIRSGTDIPNPFVDSQEVTVQSDGTWSAEFDLSGVQKDTEFDIDIAGSNSDHSTGLVVESLEDTESPTPTEDDSGSDDSGSDDSGSDDSGSSDSGSSDTGSSDTGEESDTPGFGVVAALISMLAAALIATRRQ